MLFFKYICLHHILTDLIIIFGISLHQPDCLNLQDIVYASQGFGEP
jgi:hypothetical protein